MFIERNNYYAHLLVSLDDVALPTMGSSRKGKKWLLKEKVLEELTPVEKISKKEANSLSCGSNRAPDKRGI